MRFRGMFDRSGSGWWSDAAQDVRFAFRLTSRAKGVTALCVVILGIGIGVSTALYSLLHEVLIRPLPYREPDRIVRVSEERPGAVAATRNAVVSNLTFHAWKDEGPVALEGLAGYEFREHALTLPGETLRVRGVAVTPGLLSMLRNVPARGRFFRPDDVEAGDAPGAVAVVSDSFWRDVLGGKDDVVGSGILLDGRFHTVVGVSPPGFFFPDREVVLWTPFDPPRPVSGADNPRVVAFFCLGRLAPTASAASAAAEGTLVAQRLTRTALGRDLLFGVGGEPIVRVRTMAEESTSDVRPALAVLAFGVVLLFFASCANVANLLVGSHLKRVREYAIRSAVGADRCRLVRQLVTEHLMLSVLGGVLGTGLGWTLLVIVKSTAGDHFPAAGRAGIDAGTLLPALALVFVAVLSCGLLPALRSTRAGLLRFLAHAETSGDALSGAQRLRDVLVVAQSGFAVSLLVVAMLLGRSLVNLTNVDPGYSPDDVLTVGIRVPGGYEASDERKRLMSALLAWLRDFGPVTAAGASNMIPLDDRAYLAGFPVRPIPDVRRRPKVANALRYAVTPGYAEALRLRLLEGRTFDELDAESDVLKMIVNREFARQYLPPDPLGVRLAWGEPSEAEIVGVVGNVLKDGNDRSPRPEFYVPMADRDRLGADVLMVARTEREVEFPSRLIAEQVRGLNATATVEVMWLADRLSLSIARPRFAAFVLGAFAGISLFLSGAGLYGVISFRVIRRRREIAVRRALGATRSDVIRLVLGDGLRSTALGLAGGVAVTATAVAPLLESMLFGVEPLDITVLLAAPVFLSILAVGACLVPTFRATEEEPGSVLR